MTEQLSCSRPDRDRRLRVGLFLVGSIGVVAARFGYFTPWGYVGLSLMITAWLGRCPACRLMGIDRE